MVFDSAALPEHLDDRARFRQFHDFFDSVVCCVDVERHTQLPFALQFRMAPVNGMRLAQLRGTVKRITRSAVSIAQDRDDDFSIIVNRGSALIQTVQAGLEHDAAPDLSVMVSNGERVEVRYQASARWTGVTIPRDRLKAMIPGAEDLIARPLLFPRAPIGLLLARYIEGILDLDAAQHDAALDDHVGRTIGDLLALMLGAGGDAAELAQGRGLRAARLQQVLAKIGTDYMRPGFSTADLASSVGMSRRNVNRLLAEAGQTFSERVLELRLQRAHAMLSDRRCDHLRISEVALACGFNEVPYFNRCFRRRFGCPPTHLRAFGPEI